MFNGGKRWFYRLPMVEVNIDVATNELYCDFQGLHCEMWTKRRDSEIINHSLTDRNLIFRRIRRVSWQKITKT